jgi:hypothetical protein
MAIFANLPNWTKILLFLLVVCIGSIYFLSSKGCGDAKKEPKQPATWKKVPFPNTRN